jgi:3-deoxy-7-phosphoheptulonate synthase
MIESYLKDGKQNETGEVYGKSITDPCLGWNDSEALIRKIASAL